jgi:hypothetical protein
MAEAMPQEEGFQQLVASMTSAGVYDQASLPSEEFKKRASAVLASPENRATANRVLRMATAAKEGGKELAPGEFMNVAGFAAAAKAIAPDMMKENVSKTGEKLAFDPSSWDRLSKAMERAQTNATKLSEATEKGNTGEAKKLELRQRQLDLETKAESATVRAEMFRGRAASINAEIIKQQASGGGVDSSLFADLDKATSAAEKFEGEAVGLKGTSKDPHGLKSLRQMMGGFGLMFARSIFGIATGGLGQGMQERAAYEQGLYGASNQLFGAGAAPYNEAMQVQNLGALYGTSNKPVSVFKTFVKSNAV